MTSPDPAVKKRSWTPAGLPGECVSPAGQLCTSTPMDETTTCQVSCLSSSPCPNPDVDVFVCGTPYPDPDSWHGTDSWRWTLYGTGR